MRRQRAAMGLTLLSVFLSSLNSSRRAEPLRLCLLSASHRKATRGPGSKQRGDATVSDKPAAINTPKRAAARAAAAATSNSIS